MRGGPGLKAEAKRLEDWLDGEKVTAAYKSPLVTWDKPIGEGKRAFP